MISSDRPRILGRQRYYWRHVSSFVSMFRLRLTGVSPNGQPIVAEVKLEEMTDIRTRKSIFDTRRPIASHR